MVSRFDLRIQTRIVHAVWDGVSLCFSNAYHNIVPET